MVTKNMLRPRGGRKIFSVRENSIYATLGLKNCLNHIKLQKLLLRNPDQVSKIDIWT